MSKTKLFITRVFHRSAQLLGLFFSKKVVFEICHALFQVQLEAEAFFAPFFSIRELFVLTKTFTLSNMEAVGERLTCYACFQVSFIG